MEAKAEKPLGLRPKAVVRQVMVVTLAHLSLIEHGFAVSFPAVTLDALIDPRAPVHLTPEEGTWFVSLFSLFLPVGNIVLSFLLDLVGRRDTIYIIGVLFLIGWCLVAFAVETTEKVLFAQLMVARIVTGIASGMSIMPVAVYAAETCHPKIRGILTIGQSFWTAMGVVLTYILGYFFRAEWKMIAAISIGAGLLPFIIIPFLPSSPAWLIMKNKDEKARRTLKFFRGLDKKDETIYEEFEAEFNMLLQKRLPQQENPRFFKIIKEKSVYRPIIFQCGFFILQMLSGTFVLIGYAPQVPRLLHTELDPFLVAIAMGTTRLLVTIAAGLALDKFGRRPMALISGVLVTVLLLSIATYSWVGKHIPGLPETLVCCYMTASTFGMNTMPSAMNAEIHPQRSKAKATGICAAVGFLFSFAILKSFFLLYNGLGLGGTFALYSAMSVLWTVYVYFLMPETKGKTLWEIEEFFEKRW